MWKHLFMKQKLWCKNLAFACDFMAKNKPSKILFIIICVIFFLSNFRYRKIPEDGLMIPEDYCGFQRITDVSIRWADLVFFDIKKILLYGLAAGYHRLSSRVLLPGTAVWLSNRILLPGTKVPGWLYKFESFSHRSDQSTRQEWILHKFLPFLFVASDPLWR